MVDIVGKEFETKIRDRVIPALEMEHYRLKADMLTI